MINTMDAPMPWFGGKRKVASEVWEMFGDVQNYVEPFFGSGAVLLGRPTSHLGYCETVNDKDFFIANFWRAVKNEPDAVAEYADNPVNEADLSARQIWLVKHAMPELEKRIPADINYYDAKVAGWWVWGICCWIGSGWCSGSGPWTEQDGKLVNLRDNGDAGRGVNRKRVHLGDAGQGVNRQNAELTGWMNDLSARLANVRVCCGDWQRVVTNGALTYGSTVGIFLDPPYDLGIRSDGLYNQDSHNLAQDVLEWCVTNGDNPRYKIALCGYDGEHNKLETMGWSSYSWVAGSSYQSKNGGVNGDNRKLERIWFNANCLSKQTAQYQLFGEDQDNLWEQE